MSEAVVQGEIEDVLSSIRRLVSDDLQPLSVTSPPQFQTSPHAAAGSADAGKLLLTPALRVVQNAGLPADPPAIDAVLAQVGAGVDQRADDWESETGDMSPDMPAAESSAAMWEDVPPIEAYVADMDLGLVETVEAAADPDLSVTPEVAEDTDRATEAPLPGWAQHNARDDEDDTRADPWADAARDEPDPAWADAAEAAALRELEPPAEEIGQGGAAPMAAGFADDAAHDALDDDDAAEVPVDEAMLREIVRDVLREELQGRLGERITRNIRKLVRAEIARMVASEELM